ncbi:methyltransferase [Sphingosinicella sp. CPCC 101087]|uniref:methyltransferase n=1 Tax=Sphingosinicella sp. CPCC 101087 TaxID=2497754 RepID=UPI00197CE8F3|nr:methyltransferase [Sphingosinicella sp. CPCC 101087]
MADASTRQLVESITGAWRTRAIYESVRSGLIDNLGSVPRSAAEVAASAELDADTSRRVLRALAVLGLCEQVSADAFVATELGARLRAGTPGSLRGMAMLWGDRIWNSLETMGETLRTGMPGWGNGDFGALHADPAESDVFNRAMAEQSGPIARAVAWSCDFSGYGSVMDVGGGYGAVLIEILRAYPALKGLVYDLEPIAEGARRYLAEAGVGDRADFLGGDFFHEVPAGMDCIVLKYVLHDWSDADSERILASCRAALQPGATLILLERILPERVSAADEPVVRTDLVMMPINGKERTLEEFQRLLRASGFVAGEAKPLVDGCWVIESRAV